MSSVRIKREGLHNTHSALGLKLMLRREALDHVGKASARVLDLFAGPVGEMWAGCWSQAADYLGVDVEYRPFDARRRLVAPWSMAVQSLELDGWNIIDLDAFGSPWGAAARLSERWRPAEGARVAVVTTDGSWRAVRTGRVLTIDADLRRLGCVQAPRRYEGRGEMSRAGLTALAKRCGIKIDALRVRASDAQGGSGGSSALVYSLMTGTVTRGS